MSNTQTWKPAFVSALPYAGIAICSLVWGTSWYAIRFELTAGVMPSVGLRFGIAAAVLWIGCVLRRTPLRITGAAHRLCLVNGLLTFCLNFALAYEAERLLNSATVAVVYAAMPFANLCIFRLLVNAREPKASWWGAALAVCGVLALCLDQIPVGASAGLLTSGVLVASVGVLCVALGNLCVFRLTRDGTSILPVMAWSMTYGSIAAFAVALASGARWPQTHEPAYWISLIYLALFGSVLAYLCYYDVARRRGFTFASYVGALIPPIAMLISTWFEDVRWGLGSLAGVALILAGQGLLAKNPAPPPRSRSRL